MKAMKAKHPGGRPTSYRPEFCRRVALIIDLDTGISHLFRRLDFHSRARTSCASATCAVVRLARSA